MTEPAGQRPDRWSALDVLWAVSAAIPALGMLIAWVLTRQWEVGAAALLLTGVPVAVLLARRSRRRAQRWHELGWVVLALVLLVGGIVLFSTLP